MINVRPETDGKILLFDLQETYMSSYYKNKCYLNDIIQQAVQCKQCTVIYIFFMTNFSIEAGRWNLSSTCSSQRYKAWIINLFQVFVNEIFLK
jgi:hypothetical protein